MFLLPWKKSSEENHQPIDLFYELQTNMNKLFDGLIGNVGDKFPSSKKLFNKLTDWSPHVNLKETDKEFILKADLPGMEKKDITINVNDNSLTVKGERKTAESKENEKYYYSEQCYGYFERSFNLPQRLCDKEKIQAKFENGVLSIHLPKRPEVQKESRKVEIH